MELPCNKTGNLFKLLQDREQFRAPSGAQVHRVRRLYESIVPSHTVYSVECPDDVFIRRFSHDGQFLICFARNGHELVVYRHHWPSSSYKGDGVDTEHQNRSSSDTVSNPNPNPDPDPDPSPSTSSPKEKNGPDPPGEHLGVFRSHFKLIYTVNLAGANEMLCKEFFLCTQSSSHGIFVTSSPLVMRPPHREGAVRGVPAMETVTLLLVRLSDGTVCDRRLFLDDFINFPFNGGIFLHEDLISILSSRYQKIHILQVRESSGLFVDARTIGEFCLEDDELILHSHNDLESRLRASHNSSKFSPLAAMDSSSSLQNPALSRNPSPLNPNPFPRFGRPPPAPGTAVYITTNRADEAAIRRRQLGEAPPGQAPLAPAGRLPMEPSPIRRADFQVASHQGGIPQGQAPSRIPLRRVALRATPRTDPRTAVDDQWLDDMALTQQQGSVASTAMSGGESRGPVQGSRHVIGGIRQRLLAHIFRKAVDDELAGEGGGGGQQMKRFFYHFQNYLDLLMWKVQFLDRHHLLIKFGSVLGVCPRTIDTSGQNAFFGVYNVDTTEIVAFFQNSSEDLNQLFEEFYDHFRAAPTYPPAMAYMTSCSNNIYAKEQYLKQKNMTAHSRPGSRSLILKKSLASLPFSCQTFNPSPYFDQSLFQFDEKLISSLDRHKPCLEQPIKFISRRRPNSLRFKINPGLESGPTDTRVKRAAFYVFHPFFPFVISIQQTYLQPPVVNFHFRQ